MDEKTLDSLVRSFTGLYWRGYAAALWEVEGILDDAGVSATENPEVRQTLSRRIAIAEDAIRVFKNDN